MSQLAGIWPKTNLQATCSRIGCALAGGLMLSGIGCKPVTQPTTASLPAEVQAQSSPTMPASYTLSGSVDRPGSRQLLQNQTISSALKSQLLPAGRQHVTIVLLRRGPEGMVRQIIDVDVNGRPLDDHEDISLRDGDELIVPDPNQDPTGQNHSPSLPGMP